MLCVFMYCSISVVWELLIGLGYLPIVSCHREDVLIVVVFPDKINKNMTLDVVYVSRVDRPN